MDHARHDAPHAALRSALWIALIVFASLSFSRAFACATPFVALAALAGTQMRWREAMLAVVLAWLGNQTIGFLVLHYPRTWDSFAWGVAIGVAALSATWAGATAASVATSRPLSIVIAFAAAFATYEGVLFAAAFILASGGNAFTLAIVGRILAINAVAYLGLCVVHRLATAAGLSPLRSKAT